jgi:hypothetical protein
MYATNHSHPRRQAVKLLLVLIEHAEDNTTMQIEAVLSALYGVVNDDEKDIVDTVGHNFYILMKLF